VEFLSYPYFTMLPDRLSLLRVSSDNGWSRDPETAPSRRRGGKRSLLVFCYLPPLHLFLHLPPEGDPASLVRKSMPAPIPRCQYLLYIDVRSLQNGSRVEGCRRSRPLFLPIFPSFADFSIACFFFSTYLSSVDIRKFS